MDLGYGHTELVMKKCLILLTRVLEIRQREIRQRRWKFVNGVGNSSTTFLSLIFRWNFVNNFSFLNPNFSVDSYQKMFHFVGIC